MVQGRTMRHQKSGLKTSEGLNGKGLIDTCWEWRIQGESHRCQQLKNRTGIKEDKALYISSQTRHFEGQGSKFTQVVPIVM
jgi:hypothetical protein